MPKRTRQTEQALLGSEQHYRSTLESLLEGCQIIGHDWRYLFVNNSAAIQGKRTKEELLGRTMMECYPGIENTEMFAALRRCMDERTPQRMTNEFTYPDGSKGWFELSIQPAPDGILILSSDITGRKQAEEHAQTQLQRLAALRAIDMAITGSFDLRLSLSVILEQTTMQLGMDATSVLLLNPYSQTLAYAAGRGFRTPAIEQSRVRLGEGLSGRAILERHLVYRHDPTQSSDFTRATLLAEEGFVEYYAAPMSVKGHIVGVLEVFHRTPYAANEEWRAFLETLAGQAAIAVDNAKLFADLQSSTMNLIFAYDATIEGWSRALELRDQETQGHTQRVVEKTLKLARMLGMSEEELVHVRRGALLHDIGKMGVPDAILLKPGKLTDEEWAQMKQHPQYAYEMLAPIAYLKPALDIPYCHHEKWDGSGYPRGLKEEEIPLSARIFAVVDVWDALTSKRPYREVWPAEKAQEYLSEQAGKHFDPKVVAAFLDMKHQY